MKIWILDWEEIYDHIKIPEVISRVISVWMKKCPEVGPQFYKQVQAVAQLLNQSTGCYRTKNMLYYYYYWYNESSVAPNNRNTIADCLLWVWSES